MCVSKRKKRYITSYCSINREEEIAKKRASRDCSDTDESCESGIFEN